MYVPLADGGHASQRWTVTTGRVALKPIAAVRVAELTATAASYDPRDIGLARRPLYPELFRRLLAAGVTPAGPVIAYYEDPPEPTDAITVHAAVPVTAGPEPRGDFAVVDLPGIGTAATVIHHGPVAGVRQSLWTLAGWIEDHGYRAVGYHREVYLDGPPDGVGYGVTELQTAVTGPGQIRAVQPAAGCVPSLSAPGRGTGVAAGRGRSRSSVGASPARARAAATHQPRWNAARAASGVPGVPSTITSTATPTASPIWRIMLTTADPVAKECGGSDPAAVAISVGRVSPTPVPVSSIPPSTEPT